MRKHKIQGLKKYADMHNEFEIEGSDHVRIVVRSHIPYADKIEFAREWAENTIMIHDDSCCYTGYDRRLYEIYLTAKYYTDINTDNTTPEEIADFLINDGIWEQMEDILQKDMDEVYDLYHWISEGTMLTYRDDRSLAKAVRTSFGFLFNGEDVTESIAKAEATSGIMVNALNALRQKEKEESEKPTDGKMTVAGNIINFSRKNK